MRRVHDATTTPKAAQQPGPRARLREPGLPGQHRWPGRRRTSLEQIWARVEEKVLRAAAEREEEQRAAALLFAELMTLPAERRLEAAGAEPRYWTLGLAERLLAAAEQARSGSARELPSSRAP